LLAVADGVVHVARGTIHAIPIIGNRFTGQAVEVVVNVVADAAGKFRNAGAMARGIEQAISSAGLARRPALQIERD